MVSFKQFFIKDNAHKKDLSNIVLDKNNETITEVFELTCFFNRNDVLLKCKAIKLFGKRYAMHVRERQQ